MTVRVGTIIHGALGDCYEQLCCLKLWKKNKDVKVVGFFAVKDRMLAMLNYDLDMLDEVWPATEIENVNVDYFYQYQIRDYELNKFLLDDLPDKIREKFDFKRNIKPWSFIRRHDFHSSGIKLNLSESGKKYLPICMENNDIDKSIFDEKFTVGYLWRYRSGGAIKPYFQRPKDWVLKTKSELFNHVINKYNAHVFVCGMAKEESFRVNNDLDEAGVVAGEYLSKYANDRLDLPESNCTYLKGLGYAAEMEIMSRCDLLIMMPSGFSEPLWMMQKTPVVMLDPPPVYTAKLFWNRMPLFDNKSLKGAIFNSIVPHTAKNVISYLEGRGFLPLA
ncbi:hypothetical protein A7E78_00370 [Syntrophotalea acetylenivorans]|uniref:Glycosyltransferase n=1 Tax=Syntrophotalea acetylenivorans TaxID=1842532 RepID=A0A1L3GKK3_9BACT|nr:hypothetical protein [Syntrophotalea acetylenivorans]APG26454.1 hypothetical protein A7E78_00370 [Syntrophotalea acetylenivorans]